MFTKSKVAIGIATGALTLALSGVAAVAAFASTTPELTVASEIDGTAAPQADQTGAKDRIKEVLDKLVASHVITQAQEDAILTALREDAAARQGAALVRRVLADLMHLSVEYIGLPKEAVAGQLKAGKSLGEIADQRPGKSRQGLIDYDVAHVTAQLDKLVADGKITKERADQAKAHLVEHVTAFVDHKATKHRDDHKRP